MKKLTLVRIEKGNDYIATEFKCNFVALCDGTSLWSNTKNKRVKVTGICVVHNIFDDGSIYTQVNVTHNATWDIYTDNGFAQEISEALGFSVDFTEQGMQEDELASMEA